MSPKPKEEKTKAIKQQQQASVNSSPIHLTKIKSQTGQNGPTSLNEGNSISSSKTVEFFSNLLFWGEKYNSTLENIFAKLPGNTASLLASISLFLLGITARGEWLLFAVYFMKYLSSGGSDNYKEETDELINSFEDWRAIRFEGYLTLFLYSAIISYVAYFGFGGYQHWFYYVRQRDNPETWKCQPNHWLSPELERHEIMVGSLSLVFGSAIMAALACYVKNGGWSFIYFDIAEYGYLWFFVQIPLIFMYQDYITYWNHRLFHTPWLYKNFHKLHHTYKQPTSFSVTAIHPVEFVYLQFCLIAPMFFLPTHWGVMSGLLMYIYYHGIIDHSGINFKRHWWQPWQPDCIFHDNHHQYFHVNFGFNMTLWDRIHGTARRKDRIYREDIFYGFGKSLDEASPLELEQDIQERTSENPLAYYNNSREFEFNQDELANLKKES